MCPRSFSVSMSDTCTLPWGSRSRQSWLATPSGSDVKMPAFSAERRSATQLRRLLGSIVANSAALAARRSLSSAMSTFIAGINSIRPSGMRTVP